MVLPHAEDTKRSINHAQEVRVCVNGLPVQREVLPFAGTCGLVEPQLSSEIDRGSQGLYDGSWI